MEVISTHTAALLALHKRIFLQNSQQKSTAHSRGWTVKGFLLTFSLTLFTLAWGQEEVEPKVLSPSNRFAERKVQAEKVYQQDLTNELWKLHEEMVFLTSRMNNRNSFKDKTDRFVIDFQQSCPNYPFGHFSEMDKSNLLSWVMSYPSQAASLREILVKANSELKK